MAEGKIREGEHLRRDLSNSLFPGSQDVNNVFNRLVRASGLDDRDWEVCVVLAPCEYALIKLPC